MKTIKEVAVVEHSKEIIPLVGKAISLEINDDKSLAIASEARSTLKDWAKKVKARKDFHLSPFKEGVKRITDEYKPIENQIEEGLSALDEKMSSYQTALVNKQNAEAEAIANRIGEGKGHLKTETAVKKIAELGSVPSSISTDSGSTSFIATPMFEVIDPLMIFVKEVLDHNKSHKDFVIDHEAFKTYLVVDETAVRKAMKAGIELNGVRYYTEQRPRNSR